jgi:methylenetetrahydrofolate--tRNA-(uracil-5-)-methyltransferase
MRPETSTPVHTTSNLAELVCSNSLKSELETTAQGLLKKEMRALGSVLLAGADKVRVPAGSALAVDREAFARLITEQIESHPLINVIRQECTGIPDEALTIIATGPLTSEPLSHYLQEITGEENFYFFDAVAPSVTFESLDQSKVFRAARYGKGGDDYLNCPLTQEEYQHFYEELVKADTSAGHSVDRALFFDGCMPVEVMARRGIDTLRFGPMRPVGIYDKNGVRPYAVVQLRQEDRDARVWGLVGFQTRLKWGEQDRILRMIPGLENAEFVRYGVMHRNAYINSPRLLRASLQLKNEPRIFLAGQITGVEGYMESAATGIIAGINAVRTWRGQEAAVPDPCTMIGALLQFISTSSSNAFQPINANFGLLPPLLKPVKKKNEKYQAYVERALREMDKFSELLLKEL